MRRNKKVFILALTMIMIFTSMVMPKADTFYVNNDFENGLGSWGGNGYQSVSLQEKTDGDKYMQVKYMQGDISYYQVWNDFGVRNGEIQVEFDVKFSDTNKDNIYIRARESNVDDPAVRIYKEWNDVYYYSDKAKYRLIQDDISYQKWYRFEINMNISGDADTQSIVVKECDTGKIVGQVNNVSTNMDVSYVNQFYMGSSGTMCIDNLKVAKPVLATTNITGNPYIEKSKTGKVTQKYSLNGISKSGMVMNYQNAEWSIEEEVEGVSIDSGTGVVTVSSTAPNRTITLKATSTSNAEIIAYYLIEIES